MSLGSQPQDDQSRSESARAEGTLIGPEPRPAAQDPAAEGSRFVTKSGADAQCLPTIARFNWDYPPLVSRIIQTPRKL